MIDDNKSMNNFVETLSFESEGNMNWRLEIFACTYPKGSKGENSKTKPRKQIKESNFY